jgi:cation transporter-like permease
MSYAQIISLIGSIIAGVLLDANKTTLAAFAGAFVILPGVFDMSGSLGASLSAKINHRLEEARASTWRIFSASTLFTFTIAVFAGALVSLLGAGIASLFFDASWWRVFLLSELAIISCSVFGFPFIGLLCIVLRKIGLNPDDIVGPIESSVFDILTVLSLGIIAGLML